MQPDTRPECTAGSKQCQGASPQMCSSQGVWQPPAQACPFLCRDGACAGSCSPGRRQCAGKTPQRCSDAGEWVNDGAPCPNLCAAGACTGMCAPTSTQCASSTEQQVCRADGSWGPATACPFVCISGACTGLCRPGAKECTPSGQARTCNDSGQWGAASACPVTCVSGTCAECQPDQRRCMPADSAQVCGTDGRWRTATRCTNVCSSGTCGTDPKVVFVTSATYDAAFTLQDEGSPRSGLAGADRVCQMVAEQVRLPGTFKAWLSDGPAGPATRFTRAGGPFQLRSGTVVANNWAELSSGQLRSAINLTELGQAPADATDGCPDGVWTNTRADGNPFDDRIGGGAVCQNWDRAWGVLQAQVGSWRRTDKGWTDACQASCATPYRLYCVQQ